LPKNWRYLAAMIAFLSLLLHTLVSPFKTQARLEAESA
jgi:hypothetical protein